MTKPKPEPPEALVPIPLPQSIAAELLAFVREARTGSLTLHFRSGALLSLETHRKTRSELILATVSPRCAS
jgi:hypothetical protein